MLERENATDREDRNNDERKTGGAAPAERRCRYVKADGSSCRNWEIRGQDYCHKHNVFLRNRVERPIDVPLLEDEASIVLLLSQTLLALAWGTIPVSNGRALLDGCRLAHTIHAQHLEAAKLRMRARRIGMTEEELFGGAREAGSGEPGAGSDEHETGSGEPGAGIDKQGAGSGEPLSTPLPEPPDPKYLCFRDLKKNWQKELNRMESEINDMSFPRYKESREEFLAARATPFEHLAEVDREVERAHAMARAMAEAEGQAEAAALPA